MHRGWWRAGAAVLLVAIGFGACGGATDVTSPPSATVSPPTPTGAASPTVVASPEAPSASASAASSGAVVVDLTLLDHLPATVDGLPVESDAETSASM